VGSVQQRKRFGNEMFSQELEMRKESRLNSVGQRKIQISYKMIIIHALILLETLILRLLFILNNLLILRTTYIMVIIHIK
jgi:hypothetical protein